MGAVRTSSYKATPPDRHLLGVAARTSRQIKPKTPNGSAKPGVRLARGDTSDIVTVKTTTAAPSPGTTGAPPAGRLLGYAFNSGDQSVTLFDAASRQPLETRPLGATVQWLSTEQRFWDGQYIWTYAFPDDTVQAIAIEPRALRVARTIPTGGKGPAHSLMLTNDRKTAWVNVAGENYLAVLDVASGQVAAQVKTGKFP